MIDTKETRRKRSRGCLLWGAVTLSLALVTGAGVTVWIIGSRLSEPAFNMIVGGAIVLGVFIVVSVILILYGLIQAYVTRRIYAQDNMADLKTTAGMLALMRNQNMTVRMPGGGYRELMPPPGASQPQTFIMGGGPLAQQEKQPYQGQFRDATQDVEVE